jgi:uncharacterized sulfatase
MAIQTIIVMTDTQRADMIGCYGSVLRTPGLDRLAASGMRFDRAYTAQPVCGPARCALFTGCTPQTAGVWTNSLPLGDTVKSIGQRLSDAGVACGYTGKWHLDGGDYFGNGRCAPGWDTATWYDMRNYLETLTPEQRLWSRDTRSNRDGVPRELTFAHGCTEHALRFLAANRSRDFLLVVSYDEPHHPFLCPRPFAGSHAEIDFPIGPSLDDSLEGKPEHHRIWAASGGKPGRGSRPGTIRSPNHFDCNAFIDDEMGRLFDAIKELTPQAATIYTSDHGDHLGAHRLNNKGASMYEDITRIPLIVRWPGLVPEGTVCPHPVSHLDVVPTILARHNLAIPDTVLAGRSLLPCLTDPSVRVNEAVAVSFGRYEVDHDGFGGFQPIRCLHDGRWKLVLNLLDRDELYDLERDPHELINRIDEVADAAVRDRMHDDLLAWMDRTRDPFRGYQWVRRPWRQDAAAATWACSGKTRQRIENPMYEPCQLDYATGLPITEAVRTK